MSNVLVGGFVATIFNAFIELSCSSDNATAGSHTDDPESTRIHVTEITESWTPPRSCPTEVCD